jgi:proton-dependent oligopeptide transporter, POT family
MPTSIESQDPRDGQLITREGYRTVPDQETTGWPSGVPYIIGNEACERFSYYGMRAVLYIHLVSLYALVTSVAGEAERFALETTHLFFASVYAFPMIGAIIADRWVGKYRTIFYLSLVYCAGHAVLAFWDTSLKGMYLGLSLIAIGSGGIKPCVSANVGDQFGKGNWFRVRTIFQIFYFSVNFGSFFSTLMIPITRNHAGNWAIALFPALATGLSAEETAQMAQRLGASIAFGIPGILMFIATLIFWMGRRKYVHVPPRPGGKLGLLDTISSISFFLAVGHLIITAELLTGLPLWQRVIGYLIPSVAFLALGLYLFARRQQIQADDGFLAITLYATRERVTGQRGRQNGQPATDPPERPSGNGEAEHPLARSRFWGPAVRRFGAEATEGPVAVFKIISVFFLVSVFWALFDQHSSTWIEQARHMDLSILPGGKPVNLFGYHPKIDKLLPTQIPALNPLMVMILIPLMNLVYHGVERAGIRTTPLRRITAGMFLTALSFAVVAVLQRWIDATGEHQVWVGWQIIPYLILTTGEVMVSITGLEFAYTQAPKRMKSTVMGFWLLAVTVGNVLVVLLSGFKGLQPAEFFWVFSALMAGAGLIFGLRAVFYVPRDYRQE